METSFGRGGASRLLAQIAVGDAYGAGFEFESEEIVARENDGRNYRQNAGNGARPGRYTDDTQMSLALAEAIVEGDPWEKRALADRFVSTYRRDVRPGYARGFESVLKQCRNGDDFLRLVRPDSTRNGAAMRALPLGVFPRVATILERSRIQAGLTHDTPGGIASASAVALIAHYGLYYVGPITRLPAFLNEHVPGYGWEKPWRGPVPLDGVGTVRASLTALLSHRKMSKLLVACVAFTGDTDSAAAIGVGASACFPEYRRDIPLSLWRDLENGPYGRDYLKRIGTRLRVGQAG